MIPTWAELGSVIYGKMRRATDDDPRRQPSALHNVAAPVIELYIEGPQRVSYRKSVVTILIVVVFVLQCVVGHRDGSAGD